MPRLIADLARAFVDRASVDWSAISKRSRSESDRSLVEALRTLDAVRSAKSPPVPIRPPHTRTRFFAAAILAASGLQFVIATVVLLMSFLDGHPPVDRAPQIVLALTFAGSSVLVASSVTKEPRALYLSGWFAAVSSAFARHALTGLSLAMPGPLTILLHGLVPEAFMPACVWHFAMGFPRVRRFTRFDILARKATTGAWLLGAILFTVHLVDAFVSLQGSPFATLLRNHQTRIFWHLTTLAICPAIGAIFARAYRAPLSERRKVTRLAAALAIGSTPFLLVGILGAASPRFNSWIFAASPSERFLLDVIVIAGLAATPILSAVAVLVDRPFALRVGWSWMWRHSVARGVSDVLILAPFALLAQMLYVGRDLAVGNVISSIPLWLVASCGGAILFAVNGRPRLLRALERFESRRTADHQDQLVRTIDRIRVARGSREIGAALQREIGSGTGASRTAILYPTIDGSFRDLFGVTTPLPLDCGLLAVLHETAEPLDVSSGGLLSLLPIADQSWLDVNEVELLMPVKLRDDTVAAIVALGAKHGGAPYDPRDRWLIASATMAAAAAWEANQPGSGRLETASRPEASGSQAAFECPRCGLVEDSAALTCGCGSEAMLAALPRHVGDHLVVTRRIGAGGMGVVYLARDTTLHRDVALKTLPTLAPGAVPRLREEARAMAALNHPSLATIYELETWRRTPILIVEYFPHGTLADRLARGPLPIADVVVLATRIAAALGVMHAAQMLHRDLKPSNIALTGGGAPKLLDFGLASLTTTDVRVHGAPVAGTPAYLPPEAYDGGAPGPAWDLWALAVVVLEASLGVNPFAGRDRASTIRRITTPHDGHAILHLALTPPELRAFVTQALEPRIARRYQSAGEMQAALERVSTRGFA